MIPLDEILAAWQRERPDLDPSPMGVVGRLARVAALVDQTLAADYALWGLDRGSFDVLFTLVRSGPPYALSPSDLAASTMVTSAAVAQRLNRLVAAGMVRRDSDPDDGRGRVVSVTPAGRAMVDSALPSHLAAEERLLGALDGPQRAELERLLDLLLEGEGRPE